MRITLTIDDDVLAVVRALAKRNGSSLGSAVSELARGGSMRADPDESGAPVFRVAADAKPITSEAVYRALNDCR